MNTVTVIFFIFIFILEKKNFRNAQKNIELVKKIYSYCVFKNIGTDSSIKKGDFA